VTLKDNVRVLGITLKCLLILTGDNMSMNYTKLESIHCALQELQQEFNIPNDHEHLENAFKFTEDLREEHLKEII
jgi:hypothetical protein